MDTKQDLEAQIAAVKLQRQQELQKWEQDYAEEISALVDFWTNSTDLPLPPKRQWRSWLTPYRFKIIVYGLEVAFGKKENSPDEEWDLGRVLGYATATMRNVKEKEEENVHS
jgi:hypothetical protein